VFLEVGGDSEAVFAQSAELGRVFEMNVD